MTSTVTSNTASPVKAVLDTAELLEHVLSFLTLHEIVSKSRVARSWKLAIDNSPSLQKQLFLRPSGAKVVSPDSDFSMPSDATRIDVAPDITEEDYLALLHLDGQPTYSTSSS